MDGGPTPKDLDQSEKGWYLSLMAPNAKGPGFAWLDPTRIYMFPESVEACVNDLHAQVCPDEVDLVAGIDSVGFILGTALARKLGTGFLALRKKGGLCVDTDFCDYVDYQKTGKALEIRKNPFPEGTRVLVYDQWIETGGTMAAACHLIETHGGKVAGIAAICIEGSEGGKKLRTKYKYAHCTPNEKLQEQIDAQRLESFQLFKK